MKKFGVEIAVGIFIIAGLLCLAYISIYLGKINLLGMGNNTYEVKAIFSSATGLKKDTDIKIAGVNVGIVTSITLDNYEAVVAMKIRNDIELQDDCIASINTMGLLGDAYVEISPGGSDVIIEPGGMIRETVPPVDLKKLIGNIAFGKVE
ncbi:MAG: outer membrane lipid asymmetry maintenance protein MlaD [Candidatus Scalindua sp. AMX11]|nr:MAG: outer membrane lipid asymmetry maintenance protein MlaD [Candidatus Scalindua sp.]NOG84674.1 outer membrane lipid asymmetry maintenance protein MlaD [Planctomycetota bacterium]RZV92445.1 MAG: outer membrane lipid asymmetry maintenance protein MlaD [Candidatus Scalindua sp. SCAELEC01]TDE66026.1 MAG: outer membrane lipid asymmetry maintenance protein MlaD [Candidatus Scalindua sp. AMX11]GJQ58997.1 MAG: outer membrane lipid asymmetry maintenance protein MlaD [Candidatus Scalindua sp.]